MHRFRLFLRVVPLILLFVIIGGLVLYKQNSNGLGSNILAYISNSLKNNRGLENLFLFFRRPNDSSQRSEVPEEPEFYITFDEAAAETDGQPAEPLEEKENETDDLVETQDKLDDISEKIDILNEQVSEYTKIRQSVSEDGSSDDKVSEDKKEQEDEKDTEKPIKKEKESEEKPEIQESPMVCANIGFGQAARQTIIFNEIAWMGTNNSSNDEWIELRNVTNQPISLSGWRIFDKDKHIDILFKDSDFIPAAGFYLLERTDDNTLPSVTADKIYTGVISDTHETLYFFNQDCALQDIVEANPSWPAGDKESKRPMERSGNLNWHTYSGNWNNGIFGTPRSINSSEVAYLLSNYQITAKLLITEIQIEGDKASNDFIEIYNPSDSPLDISGYQLKKKSKSGVESSVRIFPAGSIIQSRGYFIWANSEDGYDNIVKADVSSTISLTSDSSIALLDKQKNIIDEVAWGSGHFQPFGEGSPFGQNPPKNQSLERMKDSQGFFVDNNDNATDFFVQPAPNPKNMAFDRISPEPPIITSHANNQIVGLSQILLQGKTEANIDILITLNAISNTTESDKDGIFRLDLDLMEGDNKIEIKARDKAGNESESVNLNLLLDTKAPNIVFESTELFQMKSLFALSWTAIDSYDSVTPSGIDGFSIKYAVTPSNIDGISLKYQDKEGVWQDWIEGSEYNTDESNIDLSGLDNAYYCFRIKAIDKAGNESDWSEICTKISLLKPLLITEIQIEGNASSNDFIEIYNPNDYAVELGNYNGNYLRLVKRTKTSAGDTTIKSWNRDLQSKISGKGYYLWASSIDEGYPAVIKADAWTKQYLASDNGIALRIGSEDSGEIMDAVGWGNFQNVLLENSSFPANPAENQSLSRKFNVNTQQYQDTNNNLEDFEIKNPTPKGYNE